MRGYLDTPSMGLPDQPTVDAMTGALRDWSEGRGDVAVWERSMESCRGLFAGLVNADPADVGLLPSVVPAVSAVAADVARRGGFVVAHRQEFRSLLLPVLAQVDEARMRWVEGPYVTETFAAAVDDATSAVVVSAVSSHDGGRPELAGLLDRCRSAGASLLVDGTQAAGLVEPDVRVSDLSLYACAGYKGLRGPRGVAFARADAAHVSHVSAPSAYGVSDGGLRGTYGPPLALKSGAPGLDQSPAWLAWVGAEQALAGLADEPAVDRERHVLELSSMMRSHLARRAAPAQATDLPSPIVTFPVGNPDEVVRALARGGVRATAKLGRVRVGFHVYNDATDVDLACRVIDEMC